MFFSLRLVGEREKEREGRERGWFSLHEIELDTVSSFDTRDTPVEIYEERFFQVFTVFTSPCGEFEELEEPRASRS